MAAVIIFSCISSPRELKVKGANMEANELTITSHILRIKVVNANNQPLKKAVILIYHSNGFFAFQGYTNGTGERTISALQTGDYNIIVSRKGYQAVGKVIHFIQSDQMVSESMLTFSLPNEQG